MSVSFNSLDTKLTGKGLVREGAIQNCKDRTWAGFLSILALSSVVDRKVISLYPDCEESKFKLLFNQEINPRVSSLLLYDALYILFCNSGPVAVGKPFQPNHFVPIIIKKK